MNLVVFNKYFDFFIYISFYIVVELFNFFKLQKKNVFTPLCFKKKNNLTVMKQNRSEYAFELLLAN